MAKEQGNASYCRRLICCKCWNIDESESSVEVDPVEKFKQFWGAKWKEAKEFMSHYHNDDEPTDVFHILLQLYAHHEMVEELYTSSEIDPAEFEFYIPQLCTFLLHGNYNKNAQLEFYLLARCSESLQFAHRLHWFLQAFCPESESYESEGLSVALPRTSSTTQEKAKLHSVIEMQGGVPADMMAAGFSTIENCDQALESAKHQIGSRHQRGLYNHTTNWIKALTELADRLIPIPVEDRKAELRRELKHIEHLFLPSEVLYVPIGNSYHRVKRIHVDECFAFSTKERAPYLMCLEVVDYADHDEYHPSVTHRRRRLHRREVSVNIPYPKSTLTIAVQDDDSQDEVDDEGFAPPSPQSPTRHESITMFNKNISITYRRSGVQSPRNSDRHQLKASSEADTSETVGEEQNTALHVFGERWSHKEERVRSTSEFGTAEGWRLLPVIVKSNDDLRQEQFAAQLIAQFQRIFEDSSHHFHIRPYDVIATSPTSGLIEVVADAVSLDSLKKRDPNYTSLLYVTLVNQSDRLLTLRRDFFIRYYGDPDSRRFKRARSNFVNSLAAYSIICYLLQIKDRHNGNILLHTDGAIIHIDFGFLFTNTPGRNMNFERAPFKLTDEFVQLMDGARSATFNSFRRRCIKAYMSARKNRTKIILLVEMMMTGNEDLPCFAAGKEATIKALRQRFNPGLSTNGCQEFVNDLIDQSLNNWTTRWYDKYQRFCMGIL